MRTTAALVQCAPPPHHPTQGRLAVFFALSAPPCNSILGEMASGFFARCSVLLFYLQIIENMGNFVFFNKEELLSFFNGTMYQLKVLSLLTHLPYCCSGPLPALHLQSTYTLTCVCCSVCRYDFFLGVCILFLKLGAAWHLHCGAACWPPCLVIQRACQIGLCWREGASASLPCPALSGCCLNSYQKEGASLGCLIHFFTTRMR